MVQHRCTGCKEDVGEFGIRHKYAGGVFCNDCMRQMHVRYVPRRSFWGMITDFWHMLKVAVTSVLSRRTIEQQVVAQNTAVKVCFKAIQQKARHMPANAATISPQKQ